MVKPPTDSPLLPIPILIRTSTLPAWAFTVLMGHVSAEQLWQRFSCSSWKSSQEGFEESATFTRSIPCCSPARMVPFVELIWQPSLSGGDTIDHVKGAVREEPEDFLKPG